MPLRDGPLADSDERRAAVIRGAHDSPLPHLVAAGLELRLDERQAVPALGGRVQQGRQHLRQRDEGDVGDDQLGPVGQLVRRQLARVPAFDHGHARVVAEPPLQLAVRDVDSDDVCSAVLEQAVGETAGRGARVQTAAAGGVEPEPAERVLELLTSA